jgi:DNA-directed RNA polymerase specialized sigma subunit
MIKKRPSLSYLIKQVKSGDQVALEQLVDRLWPMIKSRANKIGLHYHEDMKAELTIELLEAVKRFEPNTDWGVQEFEQYIDKRK